MITSPLDHRMLYHLYVYQQIHCKRNLCNIIKIKYEIKILQCNAINVKFKKEQNDPQTMMHERRKKDIEKMKEWLKIRYYTIWQDIFFIKKVKRP